MQRSEWAGGMGPTDARLKALPGRRRQPPALSPPTRILPLPALAAALSPRDPVRVEWAPEAAVEFSGSSQKQPAKPAVALTADASAPSRAAAASSRAILERRRKHVGPNLVRRGRHMSRSWSEC